MPEWLLTDEQLCEAYGEGKCEGDIRGVSEAQAKKLVRELQDRTINAYGGNRVILWKDWKSLCEKVGLEVKHGSQGYTNGHRQVS